MNRARLVCLLAATCVACGARTELSSDAPPAADAGASSDAAATTVTLSLPLGTYTGCDSEIITTRANFLGGGGREGAITLTPEGDTVVATFAFASTASGRLAFSPSTASSAALAAIQTFDVQVANEAFGVSPVTATTGVLSIVGQTLFISTRGTAGVNDVSTFFHCHLPAGQQPTNIVASAPPVGGVTAGVYGPCTFTLSTDELGQSGLSGGSASVTVTESAGAFTLTWPARSLPALSCRGLQFGEAPVGATLVAGQSCDIPEPCGPPLTLGMSPYLSSATLTDLHGSMIANGNSLFIDMLGDASAQACGVHDVSITCARR